MGAYRGDHAVILLPGTAATTEGNEEDDDPHYYQNDGDGRGCGVSDGQGVVQGNLDQDPHDNQRQATYLQTDKITQAGLGYGYGSYENIEWLM